MIYAVFFCISIVVIASAVIVLAWLRKERNKESQKIDDLLILATCQFGTSVMLSDEGNSPVVHGST